MAASAGQSRRAHGDIARPGHPFSGLASGGAANNLQKGVGLMKTMLMLAVLLAAAGRATAQAPYTKPDTAGQRHYRRMYFGVDGSTHPRFVQLMHRPRQRWDDEVWALDVEGVAWRYSDADQTWVRVP